MEMPLGAMRSFALRFPGNPLRCAQRRALCPFRDLCASEAALFARARSGDRAVFDTLFDRYFPKLHAAARRHMASLAEADASTRVVLQSAFGAGSSARDCAGSLLGLLADALSAQRVAEDEAAHDAVSANHTAKP
jgi:hypothetical protein